MSIPWLLRIVSGKQKGPLAALVRALLSCLTPFYRFGVWYRNRQFDSGSREVKPVAAKVISIGNITTGGTGKTPMVIWVSKLLAGQNVSHGIVSRGYGAKDSDAPNDEALELKARLPNVPHVQNPDRVAAANRCIDEHGVSTIVLDDGFQHRRIARDLDIVLVDASNPFGYGSLLPRGLLREPISSLARADVVVITRCERVAETAIEKIKSTISAASSAPVVLCKTKATGLINEDGAEMSLEKLRKGNWFVFSAIGNQSAFEESLRQLGCNVVGCQRYRDHHNFNASDELEIFFQANQCDADSIICTHKDLVKIDKASLKMPTYALKIEIEIFEGQDELQKKILG